MGRERIAQGALSGETTRFPGKVVADAKIDACYSPGPESGSRWSISSSSIG